MYGFRIKYARKRKLKVINIFDKTQSIGLDGICWIVRKEVWIKEAFRNFSFCPKTTFSNWILQNRDAQAFGQTLVVEGHYMLYGGTTWGTQAASWMANIERPISWVPSALYHPLTWSSSFLCDQCSRTPIYCDDVIIHTNIQQNMYIIRHNQAAIVATSQWQLGLHDHNF